MQDISPFVYKLSGLPRYANSECLSCALLLVLRLGEDKKLLSKRLRFSAIQIYFTIRQFLISGFFQTLHCNPAHVKPLAMNGFFFMSPSCVECFLTDQ